MDLAFLRSQLIETWRLPYPSGSYAGRIVVITGGNSGLGASRLVLARSADRGSWTLLHAGVQGPESHGQATQTAMSSTVAKLLDERVTNEIYNTYYMTDTNKLWAQAYSPIQNLIVHSTVSDDGMTYAAFEPALQPLDEDDVLRLASPAVPPNKRSWRLETEADCELMFHTEISNIVMAAWTQYCQVTQSSHIKPPTGNVAEEVDATYSIRLNRSRKVIAIGEMKRNIIAESAWASGNVLNVETQVRLSKELRGYAHKYQCPQVFCFDGKTLLLLQFRADTLDHICDPHCAVDCWVLPMKSSAVPLRYALYRLLLQGFRRLQGMYAWPLTVGGLTPIGRRFYDSVPLWRDPNREGPYIAAIHPGGYRRSVDPNTGAVRWTLNRPGSQEPVDVVWETPAFWGEHGLQSS
ncbi:hypothetical protein VTH06DRAFT_980 [Thermothelomyces fergusii]